MGGPVKNKHLFIRVGFALSGLRYAIGREKSLRFQLIAAIAASVLLVVLQPALYWWAIVIIVIAMVLAAEIFNTAIEGICDFIQPENDERIKNIKDVAAGAVLVTSLGAVVVACLLLLDLFVN